MTLRPLNALQRGALRATATLAALLAFGGVAAADFPSQPIHINIGFVPGGSVEVLTRAMQPELQQRFGQPIIIEHRPGATGVVALEYVARAPADGHTLLMIPAATAINGLLLGRNYDMATGFTAIAQVWRAGVFISVNPNFAPFENVRTMQNLIELARKNPGKLNYSTSGIGTIGHLTAEALAASAGIKWVHVPYKGIAPALNDFLGGQVPFTLAVVPTAEMIRSGRLRALAYSATAQHPDFPQVQTLADLKYTDVAGEGWGGLIGPPGMPPAVVARIQAEIERALALPAVREKMQAVVTPGYASAPNFLATMRRDGEIWRKVIRENNIKPE